MEIDIFELIAIGMIMITMGAISVNSNNDCPGDVVCQEKYQWVCNLGDCQRLSYEDALDWWEKAYQEEVLNGEKLQEEIKKLEMTIEYQDSVLDSNQSIKK